MRKFLLPVKGSRHDGKASEVAALLARETNGSVTVMHVKGVEETTPEQEKVISHIMNLFEDVYGIDAKLLEAHDSKDIAEAILAEAKKDYAYVILGAREDNMGETKVVGSTSAFVLEKSPCPAIIVKDVRTDGSVPPRKRE